MKGKVLFLSVDGLLQALGRSQIVAYVKELSRRGRPYAVVSSERSSDLCNIDRVRDLKSELQQVEIDWYPVEYCAGGGVAALRNLGRLAKQVRSAVEEQPVALIHARSYLAGAIAAAIKTRYGIPYLFDTRGYWLEEKRESGRWFANPAAFDLAKRVERRLFMNAAGVVGLTQLSVDDFRSGKFGDKNKTAPAMNIPTAADGAFFQFDRSKTPPGERHELGQMLREKLVIGYVGSVNASYPFEPCMHLFKELLTLRPDAHFLAISAQEDSLTGALLAAGIRRSDFTVTSSKFEDMPRWLSCIDWGLLILTDGLSKRASMPTKLAEFLSVGVRPIQFGCNSEVGDWVDKTGTGLRLRGLGSEALATAARRIADMQDDEPTLRNARAIAQAHFGLDAAVDRYEEIIQNVLGS